MSVAVQIPQFEGPLGLLLFLIRKEEMDIFDINIHLITSQYLDYIKKMRGFDLEVAGDFVAMAASLIQIKSKMLLPQHNEDSEDEEVEDPRKVLVSQLLQYQQFKEAGQSLYERPLLGRDTFRRGKAEGFAVTKEDEIIVDEGGLFALIGLYRSALRKMERAYHKVAKKTQSIASRILEIKDRLIVGQKVILQELVDSVDKAREQLLVTFLSCLELSKMGFVGVYQSEVYGDIYVTAKKDIEGNVVERVEEYESAEPGALGQWVAEEEIQALEEAAPKEVTPEHGTAQVEFFQGATELSSVSEDNVPQGATHQGAGHQGAALLDTASHVNGAALQDPVLQGAASYEATSQEVVSPGADDVSLEMATDEDILLAEQELERDLQIEAESSDDSFTSDFTDIETEDDDDDNKGALLS